MTNYARLGLSTFECMLWLQLSAANQKGNDFPDLGRVADAMGIGTEKAYDLLGDLINKGFVALETTQDENGRKKIVTTFCLLMID